MSPATRKKLPRLRRADSVDALGEPIDDGTIYESLQPFAHEASPRVIQQGERFAGSHAFLRAASVNFVPESTSTEVRVELRMRGQMLADEEREREREARQDAAAEARRAHEAEVRRQCEEVEAAARERAADLPAPPAPPVDLLDGGMVARSALNEPGQPSLREGDHVPADHPLVALHPHAFKPAAGAIA